MAKLRKRKLKDGTNIYWVDFYFQGRRIVRSTKTSDFKTAKLVLKEIEAKIAKNTFNIEDIQVKKSIYISQFAKDYLEYSRNHKAYKTFLRDELSLNNFLKFVCNCSLRAVDTELIDKYLNKRSHEVAKSTVNIELRHLKAAFSKAESWNYIERNPFTGIRLFRIAENAPNFFSKEQVRELLEFIDKAWLKTIVEFGLNTGLRISELVNLQWSDVDISNRIIRVCQKQDFTTKSKKERNVPINDRVIELIGSETKPDNYVFSKADGEKLDPVWLSKKFKKYIRKVNLARNILFILCVIPLHHI